MSERMDATKSSFWTDVDDNVALQRFQALVNAIDDGIYQLDPDGTFVAVNDVIVEKTGYTRDELLGSHVSLVLEDSDTTRVERLIRRHLTADETLPALELSVETAAGNRIPCELRFNTLVENETFLGSVGVVRDISTLTNRIEREQRLSQYETIVETVEDGIYVLDQEYRFAVVNQAYVEMTGYPREELLGSHCSLVVGDEVSVEAAEQSLKMLDGDQEAATIEAEILRRDGTRLPAESRFTPLVSGGGEYNGTIGVVRDVSERKEYQRKIEESNERLEQFAYAASHDLQEPLRMVSSFLRLIDHRYGDELDENGQEFIEYAVDGAERMQEMIEGLLDYSRVETQGDSFEAVSLHTVFENVLEDLQVKIEESNARITTESLPRVRGDAGQLRQVFQNLLSNAITYCGDEPPRVQVTTEKNGGEWLVSVHDDGIGIDPDDQDRIFQVFERLHSDDDHAGAGIGLALCERIIERHGGDLSVESELDEGTTFSFTLPAADVRDE